MSTIPPDDPIRDNVSAVDTVHAADYDVVTCAFFSLFTVSISEVFLWFVLLITNEYK